MKEAVEVRVLQVMPDGKRLVDATSDRMLDLIGNRVFEMRKYIIKDGELALDDAGDIYDYNTVDTAEIKHSGKVGEYVYTDKDGTKFIIQKVEKEASLFSDNKAGLEAGQSIITKAQVALIEYKLQENERKLSAEIEAVNDEEHKPLYTARIG